MFSKELNYEHMCTWIHVYKPIFENKKKTVLWGNITWSEMGKQNIQAKKSVDFGSKKSSSNRPFPSYTNSHFQNEAKCKTFLV